MSHPQHPASPPKPYPGPTFQRDRRPGGHSPSHSPSHSPGRSPSHPPGNPPGHRGQAHWALRTLYGATSFSLLAGPVHAGGHYKDYGPSRTTVEATDGHPDRMARIQGPIITHGEREYGIQALQAGSAVLAGPVTTSGGDAYAVYYSGAARVVMTDVDIATTGDRAHAVQGFRGRGPGLPEWAESRQGDLEWRRGTITLHGRDSIGMDITAPIARLGRPLGETDAAKLWSLGYTRQASAQEPDVRIEGRGMRNTGIAIQGQHRLEMNGVGMALREGGAVGMSVGPAARVDGKNIGITASGPGSFGLRVRGDNARRDDAARCPVPTSVKLANGFIAMTGRDSPAVELTRAEVSLADVSITTAEGARFAVGNEAGIFRMQGTQAPATLRGTGSALAAWTVNDRETARFEFRNVSIRSGSGSLLEVGRDSGDAGPALPAHVDLSMDGGDAQGRIWGGAPAAHRVDVKLQGGASWQGRTDIGNTITVETRATWQMDGNSTVRNVVMDRGTIAFHDGAPLVDQPSGPSAAGPQTIFHRLDILQDMLGDGEVQMRANAANGESDKVMVGGHARGNMVIRVRDTGSMTETVRSIAVLHAAEGGPANYTLPNRTKRVILKRQPFELRKETARDNPSVTVWLVPEGAPYIRDHATLDLPPRRGGPIVVAEAPAASHGVFDAMDIAPGKKRGVLIYAPSPEQGEPMPTATTVDTAFPDRGVDAPIATEHEIVVSETGNGGNNSRADDDAANDSTETGKTRNDEIKAQASGSEETRDESANKNDGDGNSGRDDAGGKANHDGDGDTGSDGNGDGGSGGDHDGDGDGDGDGDDNGDNEGKDEESDAVDDKNDEEQSAPRVPIETAVAAPPPPVVLSPGARLAVNNAALAAGQGIRNAQLGAINRQLRAIRNGDAIAAPTGIHALDATGTGIWFDAADGRQKIDNPLTGEYRQHLYGFVAGIDRAIDVAAGRWHIGLLAAQANSNREFRDGKGSTRSVHAGGYATFLGPRGSYATAIVATGRYRHRMHGKAANGARLTGDFRNTGTGASIEAGRRVELPGAWFVEPYTGVDYLRVSGARYTLSDGTSVRDHGGHALQWRAGSRVGRAIAIGNGGTVTPYLRAGYAYEQGNRNHVTVDGNSLNANLGGSRIEAGVGVEARLGKGHSLYVDYSYAKGRRFEQSQALTVGFQYRW